MHSFENRDFPTGGHEELMSNNLLSDIAESEPMPDQAGANNIGEEQIIDIEEYLASEQEQQKLDSILNLLESFNTRGISLAVAGGYGLDGLYGKLTRPHKDLDLLAKHTDLPQIDALLTSAGYIKTRHDASKYVFQHPQAPGFEIEIGDADVLVQKFGLGEGLFDTKQPNGIIGDRALNVLPLDVHKAIIEMQNARAEQDDWGEYDAAKRQNQAQVIKQIEARLNQ